MFHPCNAASKRADPIKSREKANLSCNKFISFEWHFEILVKFARAFFSSSSSMILMGIEHVCVSVPMFGFVCLFIELSFKSCQKVTNTKITLLNARPKRKLNYSFDLVFNNQLNK